MARKKTVTKEEKILEEKSEEIMERVCLDSNRALKLQIIDQIEKINNRYYLLIIKKYIDNLGG